MEKVRIKIKSSGIIKYFHFRFWKKQEDFFVKINSAYNKFQQMLLLVDRMKIVVTFFLFFNFCYCQEDDLSKSPFHLKPFGKFIYFILDFFIKCNWTFFTAVLFFSG